MLKGNGLQASCAAVTFVLNDRIMSYEGVPVEPGIPTESSRSDAVTVAFLAEENSWSVQCSLLLFCRSSV